MIAKEFQQAIEREVGGLPTIPSEQLVELQNNAMKELDRAKRRAASAIRAPLSIQQQATEALKDAIAHAEELGGLELEAF